MVDFGTGRILWADLSMPDGASMWNATVDAAGRFGLDLNVSGYGAKPVLNDIGDSRPAWADYWDFLLWNVSPWGFAPLRPAGLPGTGGAVFGWVLSRGSPRDVPGPRP